MSIVCHAPGDKCFGCKHYRGLDDLCEHAAQGAANPAAPLTILDFPTAPLTEELRAAYERIDRLEADLHECREYLENEVDVVDGDYGEPAPNRAMQLVTMVDETLNGVGI